MRIIGKGKILDHFQQYVSGGNRIVAGELVWYLGIFATWEEKDSRQGIVTGLL